MLDFFAKKTHNTNMATVHNHWLLISPEHRPDWWTPGQVVRVKPYGTGSFILMPVALAYRGDSTITARHQLFSAKFKQGDYIVQPHDGRAIALVPAVSVNPEPDKQEDIDESQHTVNVDPYTCGVQDMYIWLRAQAVKSIVKGKIPQGATSMYQFALDMAEKTEKARKKQLPGPADADSLRLLRDMLQDRTVPESVRARVAIELHKYEDKNKPKDIKPRERVKLEIDS